MPTFRAAVLSSTAALAAALLLVTPALAAGVPRRAVTAGASRPAVTAAPAEAARASTAAASGCPAVSEAAADDEDAAHDDYSCTALAAPVAQSWSVALNGPASYPLIVDGQVFVITHAESKYWLYALQAGSGNVQWGPVSLSNDDTLAYGDGRLIVSGPAGLVNAYRSTNGTLLWTQSAVGGSGEPVVFDNKVFVQSRASVVALSATTGAVLWSTDHLDGMSGNVAVNSTGVYLAAGCSWLRLSASTGAIVWSKNLGCTGDGGGTSYLGGTYAYETVGDLIVHQSTGKIAGTFDGVPAFTNRMAYFAVGSEVFAETLDGRVPVFTQNLPEPVVSNPIVAGSTLFVAAAEGQLYALDARTGAIEATLTLPLDSKGVDMAAADGLLVVPDGIDLVAFS